MKRRAVASLAFVLASVLLLQLCFEQIGLVDERKRGVVVNAAPIVLTGNITISELIVDGTNNVVVTGSTIILTGNITVKDEGELLIVQSRIQFSIRGEKPYNISIGDSGKATISDSTLETFSGASRILLSDRSSTTLTNSYVIGFKELLSSQNSTLTVQGGKLDVRSISLEGKAVSIVGGMMPKGQLRIHSTTAQLVAFRGDRVFMNATSSTLNKIECNVLELYSPSPVYLNNSKATTCVLSSAEKIVVTDSTFGGSITFLSSGIATNVVVAAKGTKAKAGGPITAIGNATVLRYWYLNVNVTDLAGTGIPAEVTVTDYLNNTAAIGEADVDGRYLRAFPAEIVNGTRTIFIGNYRIKARYLNYATGSVPTVLDGNKDVWVKFIESVPVRTTTKLTITASKIRVGDPIKFEGSINTAKPDEYVAIIAVGPGDFKMEKAYKTDEDGTFKGELKPQVEGKWIIYADWLGGSGQGISTKSQVLIVIVEPRPPITLLLIRALPIFVVVLGVLVALAFLALGRRKRVKI